MIPSDRDLRHIATARTTEQFRDAVSQGFRLLVLPIIPNPDIRAKFMVMQNRLTGEVVTCGDMRKIPRGEAWEVVIPWTFRYPYSWPLPYAGYLVPPDIETGELVFLEDLIEDVVGVVWN